eukprot:1320090-Rhodomonas_salina.1
MQVVAGPTQWGALCLSCSEGLQTASTSISAEKKAEKKAKSDAKNKAKNEQQAIAVQALKDKETKTAKDKEIIAKFDGWVDTREARKVQYEAKKQKEKEESKEKKTAKEAKHIER